MWTLARIALRELHVEEHDILDPRLNVRVPARREIGRLRPEPVAHDRQVVRGEVPHRVHVMPDLAQVQALRIDVVDLADLARVDVLLHLVDGRVVDEDVADHERQALRRRELDQRLALRAGRRERLLDHDVLAGGERGLAQVEVRVDRRGDDDRVDRRRPRGRPRMTAPAAPTGTAVRSGGGAPRSRRTTPRARRCPGSARLRANSVPSTQARRARAGRSSVEAADGVDDCLLLFVGQLRVDRQRQDLAAARSVWGRLTGP